VSAADLVELRQRLDRIDGRLEGIEHGCSAG
jgi:hypothetical protein